MLRVRVRVRVLLATAALSLACARSRAPGDAPDLRDCANEPATMRLDSASGSAPQLMGQRVSGLYVRVRNTRGEPVRDMRLEFTAAAGLEVVKLTDAKGVAELRVLPDSGEVRARRIAYGQGILRFTPRDQHIDTLYVVTRCAVPRE